ncbi:MAG: type II toxin-antitoxin system RelE/ParE family toxin [Bacteroides sp.]|nr:type II toxin-antitoxin system RelE/ParE family toxin [Bacteroides sp.]
MYNVALWQTKSCPIDKLLYLCKLRTIKAYESYYKDFFDSQPRNVQEKILYGILKLKNERFVSSKFVKAIRDGLYELRIDYMGNIYRIFFIFDKGNIVILFNGFQKKTQKLPKAEVDKALRLKNEYHERKKSGTL